MPLSFWIGAFLYMRYKFFFVDNQYCVRYDREQGVIIPVVSSRRPRPFSYDLGYVKSQLIEVMNRMMDTEDLWMVTSEDSGYAFTLESANDRYGWFSMVSPVEDDMIAFFHFISRLKKLAGVEFGWKQDYTGDYILESHDKFNDFIERWALGKLESGTAFKPFEDSTYSF